METKQKILITLVIGIILISGFYITTKLITEITGFSIFGSEDRQNSFAGCLKEQEISLYVKTSKDRNNIAQILEIADAVIVGTSIKEDGITTNPVSAEKVRTLLMGIGD